MMMHHRHEQRHDHDDVFTRPPLYDWAGRACTLGAPDDAVAAVTIPLALDHVAEGQVPDVLAEARRALPPGGVPVVVEFAPVGRAARLASPPAHAHGLTEYSAQVRQAGFVGVRSGRVTPRTIGDVSGLAPRVDARAGGVGGEDR